MSGRGFDRKPRKIDARRYQKALVDDLNACLDFASIFEFCTGLYLWHLSLDRPEIFRIVRKQKI